MERKGKTDKGNLMYLHPLFSTKDLVSLWENTKRRTRNIKEDVIKTKKAKSLLYGTGFWPAVHTWKCVGSVLLKRGRRFFLDTTSEKNKKQKTFYSCFLVVFIWVLFCSLKDIYHGLETFFTVILSEEEGVLLPSSGYRWRTLLTDFQHTGWPLQQRILWFKMSVVLRF